MDERPPYPHDMTCEDVHDALRDGGLDHPSVEAHLATCAPCRELVADEAELGRQLLDAFDELPEVETASLKGALRQRLATERPGLAALRTPLRALLAVAAIVVVGAITWGLVPRKDAAVYPLDRMVLALGAVTMALGLSLAQALRPLHKAPTPAWWGRASLLGAVGAPIAVGALPQAHAHHPASLHDGWREALTCIGISGVLIATTMVALRQLDRRVWSSPAALAWFAAVGSAIGQLVLQLHCPVTSPWHMVFAHGTVGVVAVASVWWWPRRR